MRSLPVFGFALALQVAFIATGALAQEVPQSQACSAMSGGLGVSRVVEIDATAGPLYGDMSKFVREDSFLGPKEVVLTFDDGPMPWITKSILDTLDQFCTKATFFSVGQMALAYPQYVKEVLARGHTLGTHTWSHPMNIGRLGFEKGKDQIERGIAAVALAAGQPIAPFFRFPGLNDSDPLLNHLQTRGVATFTVDVVSNDSYIASPDKLTQRTLAQVEQRKGGILLFHDIKASTAKALPEILKQLQVRGFKIVHMRAKAPVVPVASYEAELAPTLAKVTAQLNKLGKDEAKTGAAHQLRPFYGSAALLQPQGIGGATVPVIELTPTARVRVAAVMPSASPALTTVASRRSKRSILKQADEVDLDRTVKPSKQKARSRASKKTAIKVNGTALFPF